MPRLPPAAAAAPGVLALIVAGVALARPAARDRAPTAARAAPAAAALPSFAELHDRIDGAVARVDARRGASDPPFSNGRRVATGAGYLFDTRGHLVTNAHVVDGARSATVRFGTSARRVSARIVARDPASDLAVLRVAARLVADERPLALAPAREIRVGDPVLALGTPYRLQGSVSLGIVSATGREITGPTGRTIPDAVQTDAAINPGNSGGPLVDARGRVVGVNTQGRAAGVSFAVGAATIGRVVPQLIRDGRAQAAYLGVGLGEVSAYGVRVTSVEPGGPAARGGVREGDQIARVGTRPANREGALTSAVAALRPGERVRLSIRRDERRREVTVTLARAPARG